tara:strand:+ start:36 stop:1130 length:1095 start_codon:yes stop_codon:yes gene_type:complete
MSYIGNKPATSFETVQKQISTSNSGTTITLDKAVTSVQDILLTIDAVVQSYDNYSVSGTTLTVGGTLNNNRVEILYVGRTMQSVDPTDNSVSTAKVQNDAITVDKLNLISTSSVPSLEAKGDGSSQDGYIQLNCSQNSHGVKLKSPPHSANQSYTLTLPSTAPATDKMLQTNSSGVLSFVDAPSGGLTLLGTITSSSATNSTFQNGSNGIVFDSTYSTYIITFNGMTCSSDDDNFRVSFSHDGGSNYNSNATTINLKGTINSSASTTSPVCFGSFSSGACNLFGGQSNGSAEGFNGIMELHGMHISNRIKGFTHRFQIHQHDNLRGNIHGAGTVERNEDIDGIRFNCNSGTHSGTLRLYGMKAS